MQGIPPEDDYVFFDDAVEDILREYRLMRKRLWLISSRLQKLEEKDLEDNVLTPAIVTKAALNAESSIKLIRDREATLDKIGKGRTAIGGADILRLDEAKSEILGRLTRIRERG